MDMDELKTIPVMPDSLEYTPEGLDEHQEALFDNMGGEKLYGTNEKKDEKCPIA